MHCYSYNTEKNTWGSHEGLQVTNRAFLYGDGFFDTMLLVGAVPGFWNYHRARMEASLDYLNLEFNPELDEVIQQLHSVIREVQPGNGRLRLTFYRAGEGKYSPESNRAELIATLEPNDSGVFPYYDIEKCGVSDIRIPSGEFGNHKTIGKHLQVKLALEAKESGLDDLIVLNERGELVESISSNLFLIKNEKLYTPPLSSGALSGVLRRVIMDQFDVDDSKALTMDDVKEADELFTTNSIAGIRPRYLDDKKGEVMTRSIWEAIKTAQVNSIQGFLENSP